MARIMRGRRRSSGEITRRICFCLNVASDRVGLKRCKSTWHSNADFSGVS